MWSKRTIFGTVWRPVVLWKRRLDVFSRSRPALAATVAAVLLAIPAVVVAALFRVHELWSDQLYAAFTKSTGQSADVARASGLTLESYCSEGLAGSAAFCNTLAVEHFALVVAYVCATLAAVIVALPWAARVFVGTDRARLARIFTPVVRVMTVSVGLLITVQAALATYAIYLWESEETGRITIKLMLIGFGGIIFGLALLGAAIRSLRAEEGYVFGVKVGPQDQPRLVREIEDVAKDLAAHTPDNVVMGLEPTFFVTSSPVRMLDGTLLHGRTLFLSLPLMRLFRVDEFRAVVGHELTHFKGADTEYSQKFAPAYARLSTTLAETEGEGLFQSIASMPLAYTLREFAETERTIGRQRELIADQGAAQVASSGALVRALIKVAIHSELWPSLRSHSESELSEGKAYANLSAMYATVAVDQVPAIDRVALVEALTSYRMAHPVDTHPTLDERAKALSASIEAEVDAALAASDDSASSLCDDLDALERSATVTQHNVAVALGRVVVPDRPNGADTSETPAAYP